MWPRRGSLAPGGRGRADQKPGILRDWLGVRIWISLVGPKLKWGQKLRKRSAMNQALDVLSQFFQKVLFRLLDCYWR